jgi:hypothetical protein
LWIPRGSIGWASICLVRMIDWWETLFTGDEWLIGEKPYLPEMTTKCWVGYKKKTTLFGRCQLQRLADQNNTQLLVRAWTAWRWGVTNRVEICFFGGPWRKLPFLIAPCHIVDQIIGWAWQLASAWHYGPPEAAIRGRAKRNSSRSKEIQVSRRSTRNARLHFKLL